MKKLLLCVFTMSLSFAVSAQNSRVRKPLSGTNVDRAIKIVKPGEGKVDLTVKPNYTVAAGHKVAMTETLIGRTSYDLQSNYGATGNRVKDWADGTIAAVWTQSAGATGYPDRGTGYNYSSNSGASWMAVPLARIESVRTGFPNIFGSTQNEEGIANHAKTTANAYSVLRSVKGTGSWTESDLPYPSAVPSTWPRATCGGANGRTIHVIANTGTAGNGQAEEIFYWRSPDFGVTWDITEFKIPQVDSNNIIDATADGYDIDSRGNTVAFVCGGFANDLLLIKSTDNGSTWTKRIIYQFPAPGPGGFGTPYNDIIQISDIDGDLVADTCDAADSGPSLVIDANGLVHVWCGATRILQETPGTPNYFPATDGLFYWNENYPDNDLFNHPVAFINDLNTNGVIDLQAADPGIYQCSLTGMPGGGVCSTGKLFVVFTSLVEGTTNGADQTYRDVFYSWSDDGGTTWAQDIDLTNTDFEEEAFTTMAKNIDSKMEFIFHRDSEPGTSLGADADPVTEADVIYFEQTINCSVGIEQNSAVLSSISVYPNPALDIVNVLYNVEKAGIININIVDVLGQTVSHFENRAEAGSNTLTLNLDKLSAGVYSVNTIIGGNTYINKIIKK
ncbi:MAG TPA: T9SS type A sorting domain-containing protein [Bacteroidia bacterium]|nr:T9SS type A sorting domain-containing protein [Bacteroidia bacterium]